MKVVQGSLEMSVTAYQSSERKDPEPISFVSNATAIDIRASNTILTRRILTVCGLL